MRDIYSVKLKNVSASATDKQRYRASYFPYERFYIFHKEDLESGLVDRMFYVYLLHDLNNTRTQEYIKKRIDIFSVETIKATLPNKKVFINNALDTKSRINWHIKDLDQHVLIVPTYSRKAKLSSRETEESVIGYIKSSIYYNIVEDTLGAIPDLIVNKENLHQPCFFCGFYLEGFQTGSCVFGNVNCRKHCQIFLPDKGLKISLGEENV